MLELEFGSGVGLGSADLARREKNERKVRVGVNAWWLLGVCRVNFTRDFSKSVSDSGAGNAGNAL